ncbi:hypothetical protein HYH02_007334 [Chlamydomonas schloesseri]|uniref:Uncharacterized protein n=1 Tax=Chlamydomonas schloesseri TaxID=2026947 RepID=A0A836B5B9_9CHLO|nr:hypothetical protein HYH02_007334 [Chlamydomonas schloesseri]|eukprot:KAG2447878.1 hypothetical protein HYH02_007334 [Chlamydomonas schloesseri]
MSYAATGMRVRSAHVARARASCPLAARRIALAAARPSLRLAATPADGPEPQASGASSASSPGQPDVPKNLTTWQYSKLADPGFAPWFIAMCFLPFVLLLVPMLSSPPMPPLPPSAP